MRASRSFVPWSNPCGAGRSACPRRSRGRPGNALAWGWARPVGSTYRLLDQALGLKAIIIFVMEVQGQIMRRDVSFLPGRGIWERSGAVALLLIAGCASQLRIETDPPGSQVTVRNEAGRRVRSGPAPLSVGVSFPRADAQYVVEVSPSEAMAERYLPKAEDISKEVYEALPTSDRSNARRLLVELDEKKFVTVTHLEVVLDADRRWRGVITRSRAYKDIHEAGGATPGLVVDFDENLGIQAMALSPNGTRIVYSVATYTKSREDIQKLLADAEPRYLDIAGTNLHAVSTKVGGIQHITSEGFRDMFPSFTYDGERLLFSSNRRHRDSEDLLMLNARTRKGISDVYVDPRGARVLRPTQAMNGTIAFCLEDPDPIEEKNRYTVWTIGGVNEYPTQIQVGSQPAISPDGSRISYIGSDGNLWVVNVEGTHATQLTSDAHKILTRYKESLGKQELKWYKWFVREVGVPERMPYSYPSWSPDGQHILYTSMEGSDPTGRPNEDVWIMRFDGAGKRQLTTNGSIDRYPLISPDSQWVYFMSNRGGYWAIWRIHSDQPAAP